MRIPSEKKLLMLLAGLFLIVFIKIILQMARGYFPPGILIFFALLFVITIAYGLSMLIYLIMLTRSKIKMRNKLFLGIAWFLCLLISFIPSGHFITLGALFSLYNSGPNTVASEARELAKEYEPISCFGFTERFPCDTPEPYENIPIAIQKVFPVHVLILNEAVLIEKFGLGGKYGGFVVFPLGQDLWNGKPDFQLQTGCSDCWRIRISEGMYWYQAPNVSPSESMFAETN